jgi:hypothetical protein
MGEQPGVAWKIVNKWKRDKNKNPKDTGSSAST